MKRRLCALVPSWQRRKKAEKILMRYVVKFSAKNVLRCEVHKNGSSWNKRIEININAREYSYKWQKIQKAKFCVMSELRKSFEKGWNFIIKSVGNVNKGATFAPATATDVLRNTDRHENWDWKIFSKKDSKKLVRFKNRSYICTPQNRESSLIDW